MGARFQSTLPLRGATYRHGAQEDRPAHFNPRSPCGERLLICLPSCCYANFNPRSPCGERHPRRADRPCAAHFNPRSPCGERPDVAVVILAHGVFQSTLPLRGATRMIFEYFPMVDHFNPRSPCGERPDGRHHPHRACDFNPRSPCGERPPACSTTGTTPASFQSTLPLRGATRVGNGAVHDRHDFNPRSPCGERPITESTTSASSHFNPRSPCGERRAI